MPPNRWGRPPSLSPTEAHKGELIRYIKNEIHDNNHLGLLGEELDNMANMLATCGSKREVYEWCQTLMVGEAMAAEVIKRRTNHGPRFEGEPTEQKNAPASAPAVSRMLNLSRNKGTKKKGTPAAKGGNSKATAASTLKPGFSECGCFATEHNLRANCANCGRIICEQESDETCYNCGLSPSTCVAYEIKVQEGRLTEAAQERDRATYEAAVSRRDELLKYAETRAKRTKVIDDQTAVFFAPKNAWMTVKEREKAEKDEALAERQRKVAAMHRHTGAYSVHLDIMNQNVSLGCPAPPGPGQCLKSSSSSTCSSQLSDSNFDECNIEEVEEARALPLPTLMQKIWYSLDGSAGTTCFANANSATGVQDSKPEVHTTHEVSRRVQQDYYEDDAQFYRDLHRFQQEEYARTQSVCVVETNDIVCDDTDEAGQQSKDNFVSGVTERTEATSEGIVLSALVPTPVMRMNDNGTCLSLHQPWAGLLVAGIKVHEGRVWSTDYRGRLWIHAASSQPHDIREVEEKYAKFMEPNQKFPEHYPTRVLLGYVFLMDCMDRERYEENYTPEQRQEESPFSFICAVGKTLPFPLPMSGNHKLFRLDRKLHIAARKQLMEVN